MAGIYIAPLSKALYIYIAPLSKALYIYIAPLSKALYIYIAPLSKALCTYIAPLSKALYIYIAPLSKALYNLYSAFIQSAVQLMPLIHPFTHTFTHQRRLAAIQGTNQLVRSNWGLGVLLRDTLKHPGWDRTSNPPTARWQVLPPGMKIGNMVCRACRYFLKQYIKYSIALR